MGWSSKYNLPENVDDIDGGIPLFRSCSLTRFLRFMGPPMTPMTPVDPSGGQWCEGFWGEKTQPWNLQGSGGQLWHVGVPTFFKGKSGAPTAKVRMKSNDASMWEKMGNINSCIKLWSPYHGGHVTMMRPRPQPRSPPNWWLSQGSVPENPRKIQV